MLKKVLLGLVAALVLLVIVIAMQPSEFQIERSATIAASTPTVFEQVNDFRNWEDWSPWANIDPDYDTHYEGPEQGKGSVFEWDGNDEAGEGRMTITESRKNEEIEIKLEFKRPFESTNTTTFTFEPNGDETLVTWSMSGENSFLVKAFGLFINMDDMIGSSFETGLADMEAAIEKAS